MGKGKNRNGKNNNEDLYVGRGALWGISLRERGRQEKGMTFDETT